MSEVEISTAEQMRPGWVVLVGCAPSRHSQHSAEASGNVVTGVVREAWNGPAVRCMLMMWTPSVSGPDAAST